MRSHSPTEHPTFKRALTQAQRDALSDMKAPLRQKGALDERDVARLATNAFERAVEELYKTSPVKGAIGYTLTGAQFAQDALEQILQSGSAPLLSLFERSLASLAGGLPRLIRSRVEFGLMENGLLFGSQSSSCEGGSFEPLRHALEAGIDQAAFESTLAKLESEGVPSELAHPLAQQLAESLKPSMRAFAERSLPCGPSDEPRYLCAFAEDLASRVEMLEGAVLMLDGNPPLTLSGAQAARAIRAASEQVSEDRSGARDLSDFKLKLGI